MGDQVLDGLTEQVLRPLSGEVGEDLAQTSSVELIQIRNQFNDSSRDFLILYENGRVILAERSKDLWAACACRRTFMVETIQLDRGLRDELQDCPGSL